MDALSDPFGAGDRILKIAVLAVGGQGGGVLSDWIVAVATRNGFLAQSTSVAGVAQRTGATIYYVEMAPDRGRRPVFALSPSPGDVDVLVAAELMEAGRAILRGFVTPDRTTLIASAHRIAAVSEKVAPGDGRAASPEIFAAAEAAARRTVLFDMERIAVENGSVISASLFGALAGSGVLPFPRTSFEEAIRASGKGVKPSLLAFGAAFDRAAGGRAPTAPRDTRAATPAEPVAGESVSGEPVSDNRTRDARLPAPGDAGPPAAAARADGAPSGPNALLDEWRRLEARVETLPEPVRDMAGRGLRKVVDYQDTSYGREYLDALDEALARDDAACGHALSVEAAKYLAAAFCYDDLLRVADLKTRQTRDARLRREVGARDENVLRVTEYFHPRIEEVCGTLPVRLGRAIEARPRLAAWLDRRVNRGRRVRTDSVLGFGTLWLLAGLRPFRRRLLRHGREIAHREAWYGTALACAARDYALAVEVLRCRRLVKGYSDTHARGLSKFDRVLSALPLLEGREDAADWLRRLRETALADEKGAGLDGALRTVQSFAGQILRDGAAAP